jgi:ribosomal protein L14
MIFKETILKVNDNSGATKLLCIKLLNKSKPKNKGRVGDLMVVTVKTFSINKKALRVKPISKGLNKNKGDKESRIRAVISRTKYRIKRYGGYYINCKNNTAILLDRHLMP